MVGLEGAGKITILLKLKLGEMVTTIATIGSNVENVEYKDFSFTLWAVGGQDKNRPLWHHCYPDANVLIHVVDSNHRDRVKEAKAELNNRMNEVEMGGDSPVARDEVHAPRVVGAGRAEADKGRG